MNKTSIAWTEYTWNPVTGCTKMSEACRNCYAEVMAKRLQAMPVSKEKYKDGFKPTLHPECLEEPLHWSKPRMVFVVSMGDLFHKDVPFEYIDLVMDVIRRTPQHTYQILTKRAMRMAGYFADHDVPKNVWLGVTCESAKYYDRVNQLRGIKSASVRFLSCEPLLGDMSDIKLKGIDWVITGGESGNRARRTPADWFRGLRDQCQRSDTPFFFKQWGTYGEDGIRRDKKANGCTIDGQVYQEWPKGWKGASK